jgi:hypothetical protein
MVGRVTCSTNSKPLLSGLHVTISATLDTNTFWFSSSSLLISKLAEHQPLRALTVHTIIPFPIGENHWVTAVIIIESRTVYVFDPLRDIYIDDNDKESEGSCKTVFMVSFSPWGFIIITILLGT